MSPSQYWRSVPSRIWRKDAVAAVARRGDVCSPAADVAEQLLHVSTTLAETHLRLSRACFRGRFLKVLRAMGWQFDEATTVLWLPEWAADNLPTNVPVAKHWRSHFDRQPDCAVKTQAIAEVYRLLEAADDGKKLAAAFGKPKEDEPRAYPRACPGA